MQEPYNNASYARISTDESLFIPECVNWNLINSVGYMPTNYRDRLMTDNNDNSNSSCIDDSNVPRPPIYTQKRHQLKLKRKYKISYIINKTNNLYFFLNIFYLFFIYFI